MSLTAGYLLNNRYRIVKLLGQGGFGAVYRALDTNLNVPCAVKENFDISDTASRQFAREASLLANLRHPGLPKVMDHFSIPEQGQYLVMEFIEGEDLRDIILGSGEPLPEAQVLAWISQVCDALIYLHSRKPPIIHRDLKPANVRITPEGDAVLVDFGLAKLYDPARITTIGARAVTPGFAPFEQYGQEPTDARTDVYALGATMYAALTGEEPPESIALVGGFNLPSPRQLNPSLSPQAEAIILRAMELMPDQRFQSATEFKTALSMGIPDTAPVAVAVTQTRAAHMVSEAPPVPQSKLLYQRLFGLLLAAIILIGAGWIASSVFADRSQRLQTTPTVLAAIPSTTQIVASETLSAPLSPSLTAVPPTATATQTSSPTPLPTSTPAPIVLTEWKLIFFMPLSSGCHLPDTPCWKSIDNARERQGANMTLISKESTYIDPDWFHPYLIFWHKYDIPYEATITILMNSDYEIVRTYTDTTSDWTRDFIDLSAYKGNNIIVQFSASGRQSGARSDIMSGLSDRKSKTDWYLQDIQIVLDFTPPP